MTWGNDAGLLSSHSRSTDVDLIGESFNGYQASGGSWAGLVVLTLGFFSVFAAASCIFWTGGIGRARGPAGLVSLAIGAFIAIFMYPILGQFDGYTTLANLQGYEAQAFWSVAVETFAIPAILGLVLGLAKVAVPVSWKMVGIWAVTAGLLGHIFESPTGMAGEVLAVIALALGAIVLSVLNNTSLFDADRTTWNNLAAAAVVAIVGMAVAPLSAVLDVKDLLALALAGSV